MKQINYKKLPASLFDLPTDIISKMPADLIKNWVKSDQSKKTAFKILAPTVTEGVTVSSDSAGLSKLSAKMSVIEVLSLVSKPKEIVYSFGKSIGGVGIGVWAADNTQMFYKKNIKSENILKMLVALQQKLVEFEVKLGMGAHKGRFYLIGGGLYGNEADFIELISEEETEGGELVISSKFLDDIDNKDFTFSIRKDLKDYPQKIYRVKTKSNIAFKFDEKDYNYPIPYSKEFFNDIRKYYQKRDSKLLKQLEKKYVSDKTVVLVERTQVVSNISEFNILNNFSLHLIMQKSSIDLVKKYNGIEIKTAGVLGIYVFDNPKDALSFSQKMSKELLDQGIDSKIGIDKGDVLIFKLKNNSKDIAGSPVNIASKISQDTGKMGYMYVSENIFKNIALKKFNKKNIDISGIKLPVYYKKMSD